MFSGLGYNSRPFSTLPYESLLDSNKCNGFPSLLLPQNGTVE